MKKVFYTLIILSYVFLCYFLGCSFAYDSPLAYSWFMYHLGGPAWIYPMFICILLILIIAINKRRKLLVTSVLGPLCFGFAINSLVLHDYMRGKEYNDKGFLVFCNELYNSSGFCIFSNHRFNYIDYEFKNECIIVRGEDNKRNDSIFIGLLDDKGKKILECDYVCDTFAHWNGYILIHNEQGYGLFNPKSKVVYTPNWYRIYEFNTSTGKTYLQLIRQEGEEGKEKRKKGLGDFNGKVVMPVIYTDYRAAPCGDLCIVEQGGSKGVFSIPQRKQIIPCEYECFSFIGDYILSRKTRFTSLDNIFKEYVIYNNDGHNMFNCDSEENAQEWLSHHNVYASSSFDYVN